MKTVQIWIKGFQKVILTFITTKNKIDLYNSTKKYAVTVKNLKLLCPNQLLAPI